MKKNENNSIESSGLMVGRLFDGIKNSLKNFSKKSLGKIGLFLIFGIIILSTGFEFKKQVFFEIKKSTAHADQALADKLRGGVNETAQVMGFTQDSSGEITDVNIGKPIHAVTDGLSIAFKWLLQGILYVVSELAKYAGLLLDFSLKQDFMMAFIKSEGVYQGWVVVRDLLNMFFMLILLFSAFATIFQVEKYHLRKMIIMLVVMALLVNFSFPITRFIIDFSNSAMYYLLDNSFGTNVSYSGNINKFTDLGKAIGSATNVKDEISSVILNIILVFIVFITFFAIALNLLIRILAFVILIILSPAGFVFSFFPGTKNIADDWWNAIFKYAFLGPIMAFFLYLALSIFNKTSVITANNDYFSKDFVVFTVPIVFLWFGLIASQRFGGAASGAAMNFAKKTGSNIKSYGQKAAWGVAGGVANRTGIPGAAKARWSQFTADSKSKADSNAARLGSKIGVRGAKEKDVKRRAEEYKKNLYQPDELKKMAEGGDAAAAYRLAEDKDMNQETYDLFMDKNKDDSIRKTVNSKVKQNRIDLVAFNNARTTAKKMSDAEIDKKKNDLISSGHRTASTWDRDRVRKHVVQEEINKELGKLTSEKWSEQDWLEMSNKLTGEDRAMMAIAMHESFGKFKDPAVAELKKRLNPNNTGALNKFGIAV